MTSENSCHPTFSSKYLFENEFEKFAIDSQLAIFRTLWKLMLNMATRIFEIRISEIKVYFFQRYRNAVTLAPFEYIYHRREHRTVLKFSVQSWKLAKYKGISGFYLFHGGTKYICDQFIKSATHRNRSEKNQESIKSYFMQGKCSKWKLCT